MPQAKVVLPAPNGLDDELMGLAIYKLTELGTIEGEEIGVFTAERPEGIPLATCPEDTVFLEFRAQLIPDLRRR
ncbi:hypothetical protein KIY82_gp63 [Mycobacterium phage Centaur]|uniref:Uncharacterized protein n=3 Tax=Turbidovirus TaxID=2948936 RepID=A0A649VE23_9CAUD|nr:hypothetical protein AVV38_gp60 [Mycobacterium phage Piro94]YP_010063576.1 hypothetical protein KIY81_gp49 [Mycobacterium phage Bugsy]YP_010063659.1 hypothetical protein KIY82_gp63 [Mycobacterium phage Centaur]AMB18533.1 hypothetical protein NASIATALIE_43 [Mycobacterium phage NaSiaTalie]AOZ63986.1 hypothetical protein SEA_BAEHEXIC_42 [Mycobacterium phage Baehexic]ASZ72834.1 hypothetical protein SEA_DRAKE55_45 [Mycobacterium phage Drake55]ATN92239.1 hypothetical protein SEA_UPDAWG_44 [Mycob